MGGLGLVLRALAVLGVVFGVVSGCSGVGLGGSREVIREFDSNRLFGIEIM